MGRDNRTAVASVHKCISRLQRQTWVEHDSDALPVLPALLDSRQLCNNQCMWLRTKGQHIANHQTHKHIYVGLWLPTWLNTVRKAPKLHSYMLLAALRLAMTKNSTAPLAATGLYRTRASSMSLAVTLAAASFWLISTAFSLADSNVAMSSWLSKMFPVALLKLVQQGIFKIFRARPCL